MLAGDQPSLRRSRRLLRRPRRSPDRADHPALPRVGDQYAFTLNGTTPVPSLKADYAQVNSGFTGPLFGIVINTTGVDTAPDGDLIIDHLDAEGRSIVIGYAPASIFTKTLL